jgi:hypothetical protein
MGFKLFGSRTRNVRSSPSFPLVLQLFPHPVVDLTSVAVKGGDHEHVFHIARRYVIVHQDIHTALAVLNRVDLPAVSIPSKVRFDPLLGDVVGDGSVLALLLTNGLRHPNCFYTVLPEHPEHAPHV